MFNTNIIMYENVENFKYLEVILTYTDHSKKIDKYKTSSSSYCICNIGEDLAEQIHLF